MIDDLGPGDVLRMQTDVIPMTSFGDEREYDPSWSWRDLAGHEHHIWGAQVTDARWADVDDTEYWCETCRDEHHDTELRCSLCDEPIPSVPTIVVWPAGCIRYIPGLRSYWIERANGEHVDLTPDEFDRIGRRAEESRAVWGNT